MPREPHRESGPSVSVALTTYNGEAYLRAQLDSIFAQTWPHLRVIAVDDGSTDGTVAILEDYARSHPLEVHVNETNLGFARNFAKVIGLCDGDFIALADQDDLWHADKLERLIGAIGDAELVYSDAELIDASGRSTGRSLRDLYEIEFVRGACVRSLFFYECVSGNTLMFRTRMKKHILPIPDAMRFHDVWIAFVCAVEGSIEYVDAPLIRYRRHGDNITTIVRRDLFDGRFECMRWIRRRLTTLRKVAPMARYPGLSPADRAFFERGIHRLERFRHVPFSFGLFWFLWRDRKRIFAIKRQKRYLVRSFENALGYGLLRWKFRAIGCVKRLIEGRSRSARGSEH